MAARNNLSHLDRTRAKIQASMLINRLQNFANGKVQMNAAQVSAALGLIKKVVPDLSSVSHEGEIGHNLRVTRLETVVVDPAVSNG